MYKIYITNSVEECRQSYKSLKVPLIECTILKDQNLQYEMLYDKTMAIKLGNGQLNPANDWIIQAPDGEIIKSYFELVTNIEKNGLRQI